MSFAFLPPPASCAREGDGWWVQAVLQAQCSCRWSSPTGRSCDECLIPVSGRAGWKAIILFRWGKKKISLCFGIWFDRGFAVQAGSSTWFSQTLQQLPEHRCTHWDRSLLSLCSVWVLFSTRSFLLQWRSVLFTFNWAHGVEAQFAPTVANVFFISEKFCQGFQFVLMSNQKERLEKNKRKIFY